MPEGPPWEEDEGECFAPHDSQMIKEVERLPSASRFCDFRLRGGRFRGRNVKIFETLKFKKYDFSMLEN